MKNIKRVLFNFFFNNKAGKFILNVSFKTRFSSSTDYWENRYQNKGTSGVGSYGTLAIYKAGILNKFVIEKKVSTIIEFGCGDGNQLKQFEFPIYVGFDVSMTAIQKCIRIFKNDNTKNFFIYNPKCFLDNLKTFKADLTLSLDVIYHLLEDDVFENYMQHLFSSSERYVIIYAWDIEGKKTRHILHRKFTLWIERNIQYWKLINIIENKSPHPACNFYIYEKKQERTDN